MLLGVETTNQFHTLLQVYIYRYTYMDVMASITFFFRIFSRLTFVRSTCTKSSSRGDDQLNIGLLNKGLEAFSFFKQDPFTWDLEGQWGPFFPIFIATKGDFYPMPGKSSKVSAVPTAERRTSVWWLRVCPGQELVFKWFQPPKATSWQDKRGVLFRMLIWYMILDVWSVFDRVIVFEPRREPTSLQWDFWFSHWMTPFSARIFQKNPARSNFFDLQYIFRSSCCSKLGRIRLLTGRVSIIVMHTLGVAQF